MVRTQQDLVIKITGNIKNEILTTGGKSKVLTDNYRPDTIAWIVIAASSFDMFSDFVSMARTKLAKNQLEDGRVPLSFETPQAYWPTPLAVMAWHGIEKYRQAQEKAVDFMLSVTGVHFKKKANSIIGHDPSIKGWPWIEKTHSWVEPTSLVLMALEIAGKQNHQRFQEAIKMLLDRQLHQGGWNYGNTTVFDRELRPMPESTGLVLNSLAGKVERKTVEKSLLYLKNSINGFYTPLSLCWSLLGLGAWGLTPENKLELINRCYERQNIYGQYNCHHLSLLLISTISENGLVGFVL